MSDTFIHNGHEFTLEIDHDTYMRPPWVEHDGHGIVRKSPLCHAEYAGDKKPWERPLNSPDRHEYQYYYDVMASMGRAKKEGRGVAPEVIEAFTALHGKAPTLKQVTAMAVEADFEYLRSYLAGDVAWYSICVTRPDSGECEYLGGILCETGDEYLMDCARQLAEQICYTLEQREKTLDLHMAGL